jgi:LytS/YehU family sensor histidine kinase
MTTLTRHTVAQAWKSWYGNDLEPVGPPWLQWVLTFVSALVIGLCFTVLGMAVNALFGSQAWARPSVWLLWFGRNLAVSLVIGYLIHIMFALLIPAVGKARIRGWSDAQRAVFFAGVPIIGVLIGWPIGATLVTGGVPTWITQPSLNSMIGVLLLSLLISFIFFQVFNAKAHQVVAERRAVEAQLKLLQAQIEPHFLFNTLAGVQTLIDATRNAPSDAGVLHRLPARHPGQPAHRHSTLGHELAMAEAYLGLMQQRMEDRLTFSIEADAGLRDTPMPALLLQPLVENAIHHGLECRRSRAATVRITIRRDGSLLVLERARTTAAAPRLCSGAAAATAWPLANIRQRLAGRWGDAGTLALRRCSRARVPH